MIWWIPFSWGIGTGVIIGILVGYWRMWTGVWVAYGLRHHHWFYANNRRKAESKADKLFEDWEKPLEIYSLLEILRQEHQQKEM